VIVGTRRISRNGVVHTVLKIILTLRLFKYVLKIVGTIETTLNTQDNDPPDPIHSNNKCSKIMEVEDEQPSKIMEATSETLEDKNKTLEYV